MQIHINPFLPDADPASLWQHYSGQQEPQPVYASLDLRDGEWTISYNGEIGSAVPAAVWHGEVLRFDLDVIPTAEGANRLLERTTPVAQRLLDAHQAAADATLDGDRPLYGQDRHQQAIDAATAALQDELSYIPDDDRIDVWYLDILDVSYWDDITADMTDEQVSEYAAELLADLAANSGAGLAVCDGLVDSLLEERDSRRAAETV